MLLCLNFNHFSEWTQYNLVQSYISPSRIVQFRFERGICSIWLEKSLKGRLFKALRKFSIFWTQNFHFWAWNIHFLTSEFLFSERRILGGLFKYHCSFWVQNWHFLSTEFLFLSADFLFFSVEFLFSGRRISILGVQISGGSVIEIFPKLLQRGYYVSRSVL